MANIKKYLDLTGAEKLVDLVKAEDVKVLQSAKDYADSLADNYEKSGSVATAKQELQGKIDTVQGEVDAVEGALAEEVTRAKAAEGANATAASNAQAAAEAAQSDVDALEELVGTLPTGTTATSVVDYVNIKTAGIATDAALGELQSQLSGAQQAIDAIEADYLKAADKTELQGNIDAVDDKADENAAAIKTISDDYLKASDKTELTGKINTAQSAADAAQGHSEGVAGDLATETSERKAADEAQVARIATLEGQIVGISGAMHFKGVIEGNALPETTEGYANGDVVIFGNKEYVVNNGAFVEFGDVSAQAEAITALTGRMDSAEGRLDTAEGDIESLEGAVAKKVEQSVYDAKISTLEATDADYKTRIEALEGAVGESGSVAGDIADAKQEAIEAAAGDATTKANTAESNAKEHANSLNTAMDARVAALEAIDHEHSNKETLDGITSTKVTSWDNAATKAHEHANKTILDNITSDNITAWTNAEANAKAHANSLNSAMDSRMSAVEDKAEANEEAIKTKADASTVTGLAERMATAEANIASNTSAINSYVAISASEIEALFS